MNRSEKENDMSSNAQAGTVHPQTVVSEQIVPLVTQIRAICNANRMRYRLRVYLESGEQVRDWFTIDLSTVEKYQRDERLKHLRAQRDKLDAEISQLEGKEQTCATS
jgi:hypothetical protein